MAHFVLPLTAPALWCDLAVFPIFIRDTDSRQAKPFAKVACDESAVYTGPAQGIGSTTGQDSGPDWGSEILVNWPSTMFNRGELKQGIP